MSESKILHNVRKKSLNQQMIDVHKRPKIKIRYSGVELVVLTKPEVGHWQKAKCLNCGLKGVFFNSTGNPHCSKCNSTDIKKTK